MTLRDEIIQKGIEIHGDKYDYSMIGDILYKNVKFPIICPIHGKFERNYEEFIRKGRGCPLCSQRVRYTTESFIEKCKSLNHTYEMVFDDLEYVNYNTKVKIYCTHKDNNGNEHGYFNISPGHLLNGEGCPKCRYIKSASGKRRSISEVIELSNKVHNYKYNYSMITEYKNDRIKYPIICPEHGVFNQTFNNHIKGKQGCPICGRKKGDENRKYTQEKWINLAKLKHGDKYNYSKVIYNLSEDKVEIICPEHGSFWQIARNHLQGQGCPKCFFDKSNIERELLDFIKEIYKGEIIENNRTILNGYEIDVLLPNLNIGFEMNGLHWHTEQMGCDEKYHLMKTELALSKGIQLIHIFEDEWVNKKEICKSRIRNLINSITNKIYARKCIIKEISYKDAHNFINDNHIQGDAMSKIRLGLYYNDELVSVMTFSKKRVNLRSISDNDNDYELLRFCNKLNYNVIGGASKIFKYFIKKYNPNSVVSYADRRWSIGNLYEKLDFKFIHYTKPSYFYVTDKIKRENRFNYRKDILVSKYGCKPEQTEHEFCNFMGWYRIYDCGCLKYVWKKDFENKK